MLRDATLEDIEAVTAVWAAAQPYLVITEAGVRARYERPDPAVTVMHQVAVANRQVVGEVSLRLSSERDGPRARVSLAVLPDATRHHIGSELLAAVVGTARGHGAAVLRGVADAETGVAFAEAHGASRDRRHTIRGCDPASAPPPGPTPLGLRLVMTDALTDVEQVRALHNATAEDDPSGMSEQQTEEVFARSWDHPDHHAELGAAVLEGDGLLACTSTQADLARGRAWTGMTATAPQARGQGLAGLVRAHALAAMAAAGIRLAATGNDDANGPMIAVNRRLGYAPVATVWSVELPL